MKKHWSEIKVRAYESEGLLLETYRYSIGQVEPLPFHVHSEYQFALSPDNVGAYFYRREKIVVPIYSLCVLHSSEPHAPDDSPFIESASHFWMLYVDAEEMRKTAQEVCGRNSSELPYFPQVLIRDEKLNALFVNLFQAVASKADGLYADELRLNFLVALIDNYAQNTPPAATPLKLNKSAVERALEFLHANFLLDSSLADIAAAAGIGKFSLCRMFRLRVGISPALYRNQLRLAYAKKLLLKGFSPAQTAVTCGFYDQSHFGKYFKRHVGVTPKSYEE